MSADPGEDEDIVQIDRQTHGHSVCPGARPSLMKAEHCFPFIPLPEPNQIVLQVFLRSKLVNTLGPCKDNKFFNIHPNSHCLLQKTSVWEDYEKTQISGCWDKSHCVSVRKCQIHRMTQLSIINTSLPLVSLLVLWERSGVPLLQQGAMMRGCKDNEARQGQQ